MRRLCADYRLTCMPLSFNGGHQRVAEEVVLHVRQRERRRPWPSRVLRSLVKFESFDGGTLAESSLQARRRTFGSLSGGEIRLRSSSFLVSRSKVRALKYSRAPPPSRFARPRPTRGYAFVGSWSLYARNKPTLTSEAGPPAPSQVCNFSCWSFRRPRKVRARAGPARPTRRAAAVARDYRNRGGDIVLAYCCSRTRQLDSGLCIQECSCVAGGEG